MGLLLHHIVPLNKRSSSAVLFIFLCLSASPKEELQALITNTPFVLASFCMRRSVSLDVELSLAKGELQSCTMPRYTILMEGEALLACT